MLTATPIIDSVRQLKADLGAHIVETPVVRAAAIEERLGGNGSVWAKLEFLQQTGTFKARGALAVIRNLDDEQTRAGVTAVSAGNHAIATAYAARVAGTSAKVVMLASANAARVARCKSYGAEVVMAEDVHSAFEVAESIQQSEGRYFVHPYEGPQTFLGTATIGLELCEQLTEFEALIVPIGGGGLCAGIASAVKQIRPDCKIFGVEPTGADSMHRSFASGQPEKLQRIDTIADSLGAPFALPLSFGLCKQNVDELVMVNDNQLRSAMGFLFKTMKLAVEPACVASTAALLGPLAGELRGAKVALIMCGSNIDWETFARHAIFD